MTTTNESTNRPLIDLRDGALRATVWENAKKDGSGTYKSITLSRTYRGSDEQFRDTNSFSLAELRRIMFLGHVLEHELLILKNQHPDPDANIGGSE